MKSTKLNLCCGTDIKEGWVNLDIAPLPGVDVVHNINQLPLPFESDYFDEILCQDILEHVEYTTLLKELHRILKVGGILKIRVPHFTSKANFIDPTHKNRFSIRTFDFFTKRSAYGRSYYFDFSFDDTVERKITFSKHFPFIYRHLFQFVLNLTPKLIDFYESTGLSYVFPAQNIEITLIK